MLTNEQLAHFRQVLEAEKAESQARLDELAAALATDEDAGAPDWADDSIQVETDQWIMTAQNELEDKLERINHALARIEEGTYGLSERSGKPIPVERLEALPTATTLVEEEPLY